MLICISCNKYDNKEILFNTHKKGNVLFWLIVDTCQD